MTPLPAHIEQWTDHFDYVDVTLQPGWTFTPGEHDHQRRFASNEQAHTCTSTTALHRCSCEDCQDHYAFQNLPPEVQHDAAVKELFDDVIKHLSRYDTSTSSDMPLQLQAIRIIHAAHRELDELQRVVPTLDRAAAAIEAGDYTTASNLLASIDQQFLDNAGLTPQHFNPEAPEPPE